MNFPTVGLDGLRRRRPGPPEGPGAAGAGHGALDRLLGQDRTWTAAQLAEALVGEGISLSTRQTRKYLEWMDARWRRTVTTLTHKQDPARVDRAERTLATFEKKSAEGRLRLGYLDECGFSPSQPSTLTWMRRGERKRMPYENPERRRLNVMAMIAQCQDTAELHWMTSRRHLGSVDLLHFLRELPPTPVPTIIVLNNAGFHRSQHLRAARADLWQRRIYLYYLPPYSPELNDIERLFRTIKHHELPERRYSTFDALDAAVVAAFKRQAAKRLTKPSSQPGKAA